ncbi:MAG: type transport system permease protein [Frankiales bacterium]|jgi:ABC-2 type transport system permease protein|nr:type transport system permease protein [Frankiales bacterium]
MTDTLAVRLRTAPARPLWQTYQWELEKVSAQVRTRAAAAVCVFGPFIFALGLKASSTVPADTLFGRWVDDSGYAVPLVVLGFAGSWGFPLLTALVAGDIFSAEDHYGTWTAILPRSVGRRSVFVGKVLAALTYAVAVVVLLAVSSLAAGLLLVGPQSLVGLSGNVVTSGQATVLVLASWAAALPAVLVSGSFAVLVSVATRNSLAGIVLPTVAGLALQLLLLVGGLGPLQSWLPNAGFVAWHGLWADPAFLRPLALATASAVGYAAGCLLLAWSLFHRRDFATA